MCIRDRIYLEAGSGAQEPVPPGIIKAVRENVTVPLAVGGGITTVSYTHLLPSKEYRVFGEDTEESLNLPLKFEYPKYGVISADQEPGWFNIDFPGYKASLHLTYRDVKGDLVELIEQTYTMNVKNHITKADAINEQVIIDPGKRIYGIFYDLKGNTASAVQFYVCLLYTSRFGAGLRC